MGELKLRLKTNPLTKGVYSVLKKQHDIRVDNNLFGFKGEFIDRSHAYDKLVIVLAGYKEYLYEPVFDRLKEFLPDHYDVCIITSGKHSKTIDDLCDKNKWSYLFTEENNVGLVQNIAIRKHPSARYIYKLDEDILITKRYFDRLFIAYEHAKQGDHNPGVIAPLLLINGYASLRILQKLGKRKEYEERFGKIICAAGIEQPIENNVKAAKFMWGDEGIIPKIDDIDDVFSNDSLAEFPCPIRFSIGAIMFERNLWEEMGYFDVDRKAKYMMGKDEIKMCEYCMLNSRPIMVSDNIVVGHFSFGTQTQGMKEFYKEHPERFALKK